MGIFLIRKSKDTDWKLNKNNKTELVTKTLQYRAEGSTCGYLKGWNVR